MAIRSKKQISRIAAKKLDLRASLWPDLKKLALWDRKISDGFLTIPRTMPHFLKIMDYLSNGKPVSSTYLDLWCLNFDDSFIVITNPYERAYLSGFTGQRSIATWANRMKILRELKFIDIKPGPSGPNNYVLIYNPYHVVLKHEKFIPEDLFNALKQRAIEIGADDLDDDLDEVDDE